MISKTIKMTLRSDMCTASGNGFAGFVDTDVCYDEHGLPYIPGKRLKGCLRECGLDILSVDDSYTETFVRLFGKTSNDDGAYGKGNNPAAGEMHIGNGKLENYNIIVRNIGADIHRTEISEAYTSIRTRTRIIDGIANEGSLRTARVLNKYDVFEFPVTLEEDLLVFLEMCVKLHRAMGLNRSRGLGEIKCELVDGPSQNASPLSMINYRSKMQIPYVLTFQEPVISAERSGKPYECEDYIFGSAVLGAFASKYMNKHGIDSYDAYRNEDFYRLFLDGSIIFTAAMPYDGKHVYTPAPYSLRTDKLKQRLLDESNGVAITHDRELGDKAPLCKRLGGFASITSSNDKAKKFSVRITDVEKEVFMHHSRPNDKAVGHATDKNDEGAMYSYEALSTNQMFAGSIIGDEADIRILKDLIDDGNSIRLGRSRTAQYGHARLSALEDGLPLSTLTLKDGDEFRVVAVTPLILEDEYGRNTMDLREIVKDLADKYDTSFEYVRSFCQETTIAGYYGKWMLPKKQSRAISEGSVIVLRHTGKKSIKVDDGFFGIRSGEGFGQLRLETVPEAGSFEFDRKYAATNTATLTIGDIAAKTELENRIQQRRIEKDAYSTGTEYGTSMKKPPQNSVLQRVILSTKLADCFRTLAVKLCDIEQPAQQRAALVFASSKDDMFFRTDPDRLKVEYITELLKKRARDVFPNVSENELYSIFGKYLNAAVVKIKQKRREERKGGLNDEQ